LNPGAVTWFGGGEVRRAQVKTVWVRGPKVTDFSALPALRYADLCDTSLSDKDLAHLKTLPPLQDLNLNGLTITDDALEHLTEYPSLRGPVLRDRPTGDAGLVHRKNIKRLDRVILRGTKVIAEGVKKLAAELPDLHIESDHGDFRPGRGR
jgi:hypothetical protein